MNEPNKGLDHIIVTATVDALLAPKLLRVENQEPEQLLTDFGVVANMISKKFSISTDKERASDRTKIVLLQAVGGQDMVDMAEMVEKVQLDAVVSDLGNWTVTVNAKTRAQAIDNISSQEN